MKGPSLSLVEVRSRPVNAFRMVCGACANPGKRDLSDLDITEVACTKNIRHRVFYICGCGPDVFSELC